MSNAARQSIFILVILLIGSFGFAGYLVLEKQKLEKTQGSLRDQVAELETREKKILVEKKKLEDQLQETEIAKKKFESDAGTLNTQIEQLNTQVTDLTKQRDEWKTKVDALQQERDQLVAKAKEFSNLETKYKELVSKEAAAAAKPPETPPGQTAQAPQSPPSTQPPPPPQPQEAQKQLSPAEVNDAYWASVLRKKAELEVQINDLTAELNKSTIEISELKKKNSDLELELGNLKNNKDALEQKMHHNEDLAKTLSLELARAKNEGKFTTSRIDKLTEENRKLQEQIKQLTTTKIGLEKSIVHLSEQKGGVEKKLLETENVIQDRISEIWDIKDSVDKHLKSTGRRDVKEIELPPIVVSSEGGGQAKTSPNQKQPAQDRQGNVVSVNEENNFVIVDLGENSGIKVGDQMGVYRGTKYIAGLEVIQIRKDISAADIKKAASPIQVGDAVR